MRSLGAACCRSPQATIKDKENGDKVDVSSLLNSGTRIDDVFTFVVGAVDEDETRTDALMVATMDTKDKTINVMNIPRDTMCNNTATGASKKINAAYGMDTGGKGGNIEQTSKPSWMRSAAWIMTCRSICSTMIRRRICTST